MFENVNKWRKSRKLPQGGFWFGKRRRRAGAELSAPAEMMAFKN
jgi:hypothetical protein